MVPHPRCPPMPPPHKKVTGTGEPHTEFPPSQLTQFDIEGDNASRSSLVDACGRRSMTTTQTAYSTPSWLPSPLSSFKTLKLCQYPIDLEIAV